MGKAATSKAPTKANKEDTMAKAPEQELSFEEQFPLQPLVRKSKAVGENDIEGMRKNVIKGIEAQIETVTHEINGTKPEPKEPRTNRDGKTVTQRVTRWYTPDGQTEIRYGQQTLFKDRDGRTLTYSAGSLERLPDLYRMVIDRINAGKYDDEIRAARGRIRGGSNDNQTQKQAAE